MTSKILILLLALISVSAFGQQTKLQDLEIQERIRVMGRSDSTTISNVGQIQFDAADDKFRFNDGNGWFSFLKEGDATDGWPLSGTGSIIGSSTIAFGALSLATMYVATDTFAIDFNVIGGHSGPRLSFASHGFLSEPGGHVSIGTASTLGTDSVRLSFESYLEDAQAVFYDWRGAGKRGIEYSQYDSTEWTDSTLVTKAYVDGKVSSGAFWPLSGTASLTDDVEITSEDSLKLSPQVLMTTGQYSFVWDTTTVANNSSEVLTKDFFENFAEGMTSGYKVTAVIKITCIGVGFTQALGYYAGEKVYTVRRSYNGALAIVDSETIYQHNADEQPVDHVLTVNGTGDSDDVLDLTISIGVVPDGMQFVTRVEVIYHAVYYEI